MSSSSTNPPTKGSDGEFLYSTRIGDVDKRKGGFASDKWFEVSHNVKDYKPEELEIKVNQDYIKLKGKQAMKSFYKEFILEDGVRPDNLFCAINAEGLLIISGPISASQSDDDNAPKTASPVTKSVEKSKIVKASLDLECDENSSEIANSEDVSKEITRHEGKFDMKVQLSEYKEEEIQVKITRRLVIICAKHATTTTTRQLSKKFTIPGGVKPETITSNLTSEGVLTISAPIDEQLLRTQQSAKTTTTVVSSGDEHIIRTTQGGSSPTEGGFVEKVNVKGYKVEEITIKVTKTTIRIEASQKTEFSKRSFYKEFTLPEGLKPETVKSNISPDGILTISAPLSPKLGPGSDKTVANTTDTQISSTTTNKTTQQVSQVREDSVQKSTSDVATTVQVQQQQQITDVFEPIQTNETIVNTKVTNVQVVEDNRNDEKFQVIVNVSEYKPNQLRVKITKTTIIIEGKIITETSRTEFYKSIIIPDGVKPETITSTLTPNGILIISAPKEVVPPNNTTTTINKTDQTQINRQQQTVEQHQHVSTSTSTSKTVSNTSRKIIKQCVISSSVETNEDDTRFEDVSQELCPLEDDKFEINLNLPEYNPDEITVKISKTMVTIIARHETTSSVKEIFKKFTIPEGTKPEDISCNLTENGVLTISVVRKQQKSITTTTIKKDDATNASQIQTKTVDQTVENVPKLEPSAPKPIVKPNVDLDADTPPDSTHEDLTKQIVKVDDGKKFQVNLDLKEYKAEEIRVRITRKVVIIESIKTSTTTNRNQISKKFAIPEGVKPEDITTEISPSGELTIVGKVDDKKTITTTTTSTTPTSTPTPQPVKEDVNVKPNIDLDAETPSDSTHEDLTKQIVKVDDGKKFQVKLDLKEHKAEEIRVRITRKVVIIESINTSTTTNRRLLSKKFVIPEGVKPEDITTEISPSGELTIVGKVDDKKTITTTTTSTTPTSTPTPQPVKEDVNVKPNIDLDAETPPDSTHDDLTKQIVKIKDGKNFQINLDVKEYTSQEIRIRITRKVVIIEATSSTTTRKVSKKLTIPQGVKPEEITTTITPSGELIISGTIDEKSLTTTTTTTTSPKPQTVKQYQDVKPNIDLDAETPSDSTHEDLTKQIIKVNDGKNFQINLDVKEYTSQEVRIRITRKVVIIEATSSTTTRKISKKFTIPQGVKPEEIATKRTSSGELIISGTIDEKSLTTRTTNVTTKQTLSKKSIKSSIVSSETLKSYNFDKAETYTYEANDSNTFEKSIKISKEYSSDELEVKMAYNIKGFNWVILEGKQQLGAEFNFKSQEFTNMFTVPKGVKLENVTCDLSEESVMTFIAPVDKV